MKCLKTMKKIVILTFALLSAVTGIEAASPQTDGFSFSAETRCAIPFGDGKEFSSIDVDAVFGYHFNDRWAVVLPVTGATGLFNASGVKSYETTLLAGLGFEYNFVRGRSYSLSISPRVQASLYGDWKHVSYDVGLRYRRSSPYVGLGVRYIDTYDSPFKSRFCIYAAFGFTLF